MTDQELQCRSPEIIKKELEEARDKFKKGLKDGDSGFDGDYVSCDNLEEAVKLLKGLENEIGALEEYISEQRGYLLTENDEELNGIVTLENELAIAEREWEKMQKLPLES